MSKLVFQSTKTYTHAQGLSCVFRQHKAQDSHCSQLHGYALQVRLVFEAVDLDERNWVVDFGGLKDVKDYLVDNFDHRVLVSRDDPHLENLMELDRLGIVNLNLVDGVGCEMFCDMIYGWVNDYIIPNWNGRVVLRSVEVREHEANSALLVLQDD